MVSALTVEDVFGVSGNDVASYVERDHVDDAFLAALHTDQQIVVYGASKQGKTALVKKHINYDDSIVITLSPKTTLRNIYQAIVRKYDVPLLASYTEGTGDASKIRGKASIQGTIAVIRGRGEIAADVEHSSKLELKYDRIEYNLDLPDDVASLIREHGTAKPIILENFHYLSEEVQREFAFDLRSFHDLKIKFIILGVWKEANRLNQFNGELQDRLAEVPVEPWSDEDFRRIVKKGEDLLNVKMATALVEECIDSAFSSVGVFQELIKYTCLEHGVKGYQVANKFMDDPKALARAIDKKTSDYSGRHLKNLEAIACGNAATVDKSKPIPYFLSYYVIMHILEVGFDGFNGGLSADAMLPAIKRVHHRAENLKIAHLTNALTGLTGMQSGKGINPPVLAYDSNSRQLKVVDSTFYFFLKNANLGLIKEDILSPLDALEEC
ncbi:hypothetical protein EON09_04520 [Pseudomonas soli]|uniref:hypothetical protein n=1 Tax=Pseudomonas TaxID=286 RepID=UPI000CDC8303|nr:MULTISPECIES: hypothetical protein [Pseudomonas]AUY31939.1 hypothetical protein C3F42_01265 [Pseudomonas sp. PONIH3]NBK37792.1 hypothetical protein [Pseudomonas soli]WJO19504.1 hypothetical protein LU688_14490 [Pseudomonas soli]